MTFEKNPFRVLNVSIYDTKATIAEQADDLSFAEPENEKIFAQAQDILLNPKKRIAAEVRLLVGENLDIENLSEDILRVDKKFSALKAENLREQINAARAKSKFPAVNDTKAITDELKNLRNEIRSKIQSKLQSANHKMRVSFANFVVDKLAAGNFGVVVEDFFDSYRLEMSAFLDETAEKISDLLDKLKVHADKKFLDDLAFHVTEFVRARKPLDEFTILEGTNDFDDSARIFLEVRNLAAELYNEQKLIDESLKIMRLLAEKFSYLPEFPAEVIREEIEILEEAKRRQPTQAFLDAMAEFEAIKKSMERDLHFTEGFKETNRTFYGEVFRPRHAVTLKRLMVRRDMKLDEWRTLNLAAAVIYAQMGAAMTWAVRADFALECYEKALPYALASGDAKIIARVRQDVDEMRQVNAQLAEVKRQIAANSSRSSSGCFSVVAAVVIVVALLLS